MFVVFIYLYVCLLLNQAVPDGMTDFDKIWCIDYDL